MSGDGGRTREEGMRTGDSVSPSSSVDVPGSARRRGRQCHPANSTGVARDDDDKHGGWEPDEDRRQHAAVLVFARDRRLGERHLTAPLLRHDASAGDDDGQQQAVVHAIIVEVCLGFFSISISFMAYSIHLPGETLTKPGTIGDRGR